MRTKSLILWWKKKNGFYSKIWFQSALILLQFWSHLSVQIWVMENPLPIIYISILSYSGSFKNFWIYVFFSFLKNCKASGTNEIPVKSLKVRLSMTLTTHYLVLYSNNMQVIQDVLKFLKKKFQLFWKYLYSWEGIWKSQVVQW